VTRSVNTITFARALVATNLKASLALRGAFVMQALFMALNNLAFFVFWWVLMRQTPSLRGWRLGDIQVLFGVVAAGYGLTVTLAGGVRYLGQAIEDGALDTLLTQPKPVLLHALGLRLQPSGFGDVLSGLLFILWSGQVSWRTAPAVGLAIIAGAVVCAACGIVLFSLAFWVGRVETAARQLWELLLTFSLYPEPLFGGALRLALFTILPAGFVGYLPARVIREPSLQNVSILTIGAVVYLVAAVQLFDAGLRRYASGSRFTTFG
jgi:viologen exporter family transport system permease protein